ncbi:MAG: transketolase [Anaerolinea sp.]|nr:transketolase [Anaerolinea sp.]
MSPASPPWSFNDLPNLMALMLGDGKHAPSADSTIDILWVLYDRILRVNPDAPDDPLRDRFLLSKGHGPVSFYAVLAAKGFIPIDELRNFAQYESILGHHPDRLLIPGVEISSGSLGHGLPIAVGVTLGLRARGLDGPRVFCLIGDGELDEGTNNEAIALAGRLGLGALTVIVVRNDSCYYGWPGGIASRFIVEGWSGGEVDGHDHAGLEAALLVRDPLRPTVVVAQTEANR